MTVNIVAGFKVTVGLSVTLMMFPSYLGLIFITAPIYGNAIKMLYMNLVPKGGKTGQ